MAKSPAAKTVIPQHELTAVEDLPPANPYRSVTFADMPRYVQQQEKMLPEDLHEMANEIVRLSRLGCSWSGMAGRLGLFPDELRKLFMAYPEQARASAFGLGVGSEDMTEVVYEKAVVERDLSAAMFWLKARGGFEPPPQKGTSISVTSGDVTVSVDLDRLRDMAAEQASLIDGEFKDVT
jgi:hypothetical protein